MVALRAVCVAACLAVPAVAQTTWIVDLGGGPGFHFTTIAPAVAAASDGDTILVRAPQGPGVYTGFSTGKSLTIVGEGGGVPLDSFAVPVAITGLPVGGRFRMAGFQHMGEGELRYSVTNCQGEVHLENLRAREPGPFGPVVVAIDVLDAAFVSLRDVETFGLPALRIRNSRAVVTNCRLGLTSLGLGGGPAMDIGLAAEVDVVEPRFDTGGLGINVGIDGGSTLRIGGSSASYLRSQGGFGGFWVLSTVGSSVTIDPAVQLLPGGGQPPFVVTGPAPTFAALPGSWCDHARPGQPVAFTTSAPAGAAVFPVLGRPIPPSPTPLGTLQLDPAAGLLFLPGALVPAGGTVTTTLGLPTSLPLGETFASQAIVFDGGLLSLGTAVVFTVH